MGAVEGGGLLITDPHVFLQGHALDVLRTLSSESVHCVITSPPYFGLRDYGIPHVVWDGAEGCEHAWGPWQESHEEREPVIHGKSRTTDRAYGNPSRRFDGNHQKHTAGAWCSECGAYKGSLGLEPILTLYVDHLVQVFREVRRVLREDGTLWLNMGDAYAGSGPKQATNAGSLTLRPTPSIPGLKPKDLIGLPWRVAFALQADGWWLRSDIVWEKPNVMPESVRDRPVRAHEYVFLLAKAERYFYDAKAVKGRATASTLARLSQPTFTRQTGGPKDGDNPSRSARKTLEHLAISFDGWRNLRDVWAIPLQPSLEAHKAMFPEALVEPCIKAGTSEHGCCKHCGKPWERLVEKRPSTMTIRVRDAKRGVATAEEGYKASETEKEASAKEEMGASRTLGFRPACSCPKPSVVPCVVLDPFAGSGTVALVAKKLGRRSISIDIKPEYIELAKQRVHVNEPTLWEV